MKKILLIAITCALIISATACGGDSKEKSDKKNDKETKIEVVTDEKGEAVTDENGETMVKDPEETDPTATDETDKTEESTPEGTVITPNTNPEENDPDEEIADGYITYTDEDGNEVTEEHREPEKQEIKDNTKWPSEVPSEVPAYTAFTKMDDPFYQDYGTYGQWTMGYYTTEADYNAYLEKLENNGFVKSDKIYGIWGKGNICIDTWPEESEDGYWISLDVFKFNDPGVPEEFFAFETAHAIYSVEKKDGRIDIAYECGSDFEGEAKVYLETLSANGFTVTDNTAVKNVSGKEYKCTIDTEKQVITYRF